MDLKMSRSLSHFCQASQFTPLPRGRNSRAVGTWNPRSWETRIQGKSPKTNSPYSGGDSLVEKWGLSPLDPTLGASLRRLPLAVASHRKTARCKSQGDESQVGNDSAWTESPIPFKHPTQKHKHSGPQDPKTMAHATCVG